MHSSRSQSPQFPFDAYPHNAAQATSTIASNSGTLQGLAGGPCDPQEPLSQEAKSQLDQQATVADERAAVQESSLHNTGRDMGDWLGVDHGVCLTARVSSAPSLLEIGMGLAYPLAKKVLRALGVLGVTP